MKVPQIAGTSDVVGLQNAIALVLLADARLKDVPVMLEIHLHAEADAVVDMLWGLPRSSFTVTPDGVTINSTPSAGGRVGAGILIEMPKSSTSNPAVSGPPSDWDIEIVSFDERNTNLTPTVGLGILSEQLAQVVKDILHKLYIFTYGELVADKNWMTPAKDWMDMKPGVFANRTSLRATVGVNQTPRSALVTLGFSGGNCSLTCADGSARILYTTDGTMPVASNSNAVEYSAPFAADPGVLVLAASSKAGLNTSPINGATAP